jgi:hypothetical protein
MPIDLTRYYAVRPRMRKGDVIFFQGAAPISGIIDVVTFSVLSHVGAVLNEYRDGADVVLTNSTITGSGKTKRSGPQHDFLGKIFAAEYGNARCRAWWAPLRESFRARMDWAKYDAAAAAAEGTQKYAVRGLFGFLVRQLPVIGSYFCQAEDSAEVVCSGYVTELNEAAGGLVGFNYSKESPQDVAEMGIYDGDQPVQILGTPGKIRAFNTL